MKVDKTNSYYITVEFRRQYDEDVEYIEEIAEEHGLEEEEEAAMVQFAKELQAGYDAAGIAGHFEIIGLSDTPKSPKFQA